MRGFLDPWRVDSVTIRHRKVVIALNAGAAFMGGAALLGFPLLGLALLSIGSVLWLCYQQLRADFGSY